VALVEADARHARDLGVDPRVVMPEEAHARPSPREQIVETGHFADKALAPTVAIEAHPGGCVVGEDDVEVRRLAQRLDLVARVVPLGVALQRRRAPPEAGWSEAAADAADLQDLLTDDELVDAAVPKIVKAGQDFGGRLRVEPHEVLVVALDEHGGPRRGAALREPDGEVARAVVPPRGPVDARGIGPHAEVADVQHPVDAHAERRLEREHARVHPVETAVDVTCRAEDHGSPSQKPPLTASRPAPPRASHVQPAAAGDAGLSADLLRREQVGQDLGDRDKKQLVVCEEEAERVRTIFRMYLRLGSVNAVATRINDLGWMKKGFRAKTGRMTSPRQYRDKDVHSILRNVTYLGKVEFNGELYEGEHEAIVSEELFARVQSVLTSKASRTPPSRSRRR